MALISIQEYAQKNGKAQTTVRQKAAAGGFETARKIGRNWVIEEDEPYTDNRVKSGKYRDARKKNKPGK
ncbi:DNA-binding protein [Eubacterium sp.]|uniref:DNA-binding protein n=1 Tax=Eubacterium sp. TaxID=142586 RepID=UPI002FCBFBB2